MSHLDAEKLDALLKNPAAHPELRLHLSTCDICLEAIEKLPNAMLDAATDQALLAVRGDVGDFVRTARVQVRPSRRRRRIAGAAVALAAMVLAGVFIAKAVPVSDGLKGTRALTVSLTALHRASDGALLRVDNGQAVPASGTLLLRYQASEAAKVPVVLVRENGAREELGTVDLNAGLNDLPLGVSLEGEHGRLEVDLGSARLFVQVVAK